jgi:hypothetical protein
MILAKRREQRYAQRDAMERFARLAAILMLDAF